MKLYKKSLNTSPHSYIWTHSFLEFFCAKILYVNPFLNAEEILRDIRIEYDFLADNLNYSCFKRLLAEKFGLMSKSRFMLFDSQSIIISLIKKIKYATSNYEHLSVERLIDALEVTRDDAIFYIQLIENISNNLDKNDYNTNIISSLIYHIYLGTEGFQKDFRNTLKSISKCYRRMSANVFFPCISDISIKIEDLQKYSSKEIITLFNVNIFDFEKIINLMEEDIIVRGERIFAEAINQLNEREYDIISARNGWDGKEQITLEELGLWHNLTRERIRQIELKAGLKIRESLRENDRHIDMLLKYLVPKQGFVTKEDLSASLSDKALEIISFYIPNEKKEIKYDTDYGVLFSPSKITCEQIKNKLIKIYGNVIPAAAIQSKFHERVIRLEYYPKNSNFIRKGILANEMIFLIIDEFFPNGFHVSSQEDLNLFKDKFEERYGESEYKMSIRSIVAILERFPKRFILRNKGLIISKKYTVSLKFKLVNKIINYIISNRPVIYYTSIYEVFKEELLASGVDNYYYLKGIIDNLLPQDFSTKRNYVMAINEGLSSRDVVINYMKSFSAEFSIGDLQKRFPGVKEYVFMNYIYDDSEIIWLSEKRFVFQNNMIISASIVKELKEEVLQILDSLKIDTIISSKLFARISLTRKELIKQIPLIITHYDLFSILRALYPTDFYYKRPIISTNEIQVSSLDELLYNYARQLDRFSKNDMDLFSAKMSIREVVDYQNFMDYLAEEFVQYSIDEMMKKEIVDFDENFIDEVKEVMYMLTETSEIDTRIFKDYFIFPKCLLQWNKYLLKGFICSYLSGEYMIEYTAASYNRTDYIIRRI